MSSKLFSCKEEGKANAFLLTPTLEFNDSRALSGVQNGPKRWQGPKNPGATGAPSCSSEHRMLVTMEELRAGWGDSWVQGRE